MPVLVRAIQSRELKCANVTFKLLFEPSYFLVEIAGFHRMQVSLDFGSELQSPDALVETV